MIRVQRVGSCLVGVLLVVAGQYLVLRREPFFALPALSEALNSQYRIDVNNLDNVILAVPLFLAGALLFAYGVTLPAFSDLRLSTRPIRLRSVYTGVRRWFAPTAVAAMLFAFLWWMLSSGEYNGLLPIAWITSLVIAASVAGALDRRARVSLSLNLGWRDVVFILALLGLGLGIGAYKLAQVPNSLIGDEGSFWETARAIATGQYQPPIFGLGVYSYPILSSIYQAWVLRIFGASLWSWRFASVLAGVAAVAPTYLLAREMFDRRVAVLAGATMVALPYFIAFERLGYNNSQSLLPVAFTLYFLYAGLRRGSLLYLLLSGVMAGLAFYTYTAGRLGLTVVALFFAYLLIVHVWQSLHHRPNSKVNRSDQSNTLPLLIALGVAFSVGWAVIAMPGLVYANHVDPSGLRYKTLESIFPNVNYARDLFPDNQLFDSHAPIQIGNQQFFVQADIYRRLLVRGILRSLLVFQHDGLVTQHFIDAPLAGPGSVVFYFIGLVLVLANLHRKNFALLALWFLGGLVFLSVISTFPPRYQHTVPVIPALSILIALGVVSLADLLASLFREWQRGLSGALMAACFLLFLVTGLKDYFVDVQALYVPNLEQWMAFTALELKAPRQMIYVYDDPQENGFVPWVIQNLPTLADFHAVSNVDLADGRFKVDSRTAYIFFLHQEDEDTIGPVLANAFNRLPPPDIYRDHEGRILGLSYTLGQDAPVETAAGTWRGVVLPIGVLLLLGLIASYWRFVLPPAIKSSLRVRVGREWANMVAELRAPLSTEREGAEIAASRFIDQAAPIVENPAPSLVSRVTQILRDTVMPAGVIGGEPGPRSGVTQSEQRGADRELRVRVAPTGLARGFELPRLSLRAALAEGTILFAVTLAFSLKFLDFNANRLPTGNEFDVVTFLDFVLLNSLRQFGQLPLWNFYLHTGQPFIADPFLHIFNPISTLPVLLWGVVNGFKVGIFLSFGLAATGQWLFSRVLGLNRAARLWTALLYALNGQAVARFIQGEYDFTLGYAWIPFVFAGVLMALQTRQRKYYALTAVAFTLLFFSGNVYYSYYMALILGILTLVWGFQSKGWALPTWSWDRIKPLLAIGLLTLGLSAVQLFPTVEFWPHIQKVGDPELLTSQPLSEILQDYISTSIQRPVALEHLPPEESYGYIGVAPFLAGILGLVALWRSRRKEGLLLLGLFLLTLVWIAARYTPIASIYRQVPLLYEFRYPSRIIIFGACAIISIGGIGLTWLMEEIGRIRWPSRDGWAGATLTAILLVGMLFSVGDVFQANQRFVGTRDLYQDASSILEWLHAYDPNPNYVSIPISSLWHFAAASNEERFWDAWYGFNFFPPVAGNPNIRLVAAKPNYLVLGKDQVPSTDDAIFIKDFPSFRVYTLRDSLPYAFAVSQDVLAATDAGELTGAEVQPVALGILGPNAIRITANTTTAENWIVALTSFYPGWRASVDGRSAELSNVGQYLAVRASPGQHTYVFTFDPASFKIGLIATLLTLFVILGLLVTDLKWVPSLGSKRRRGGLDAEVSPEGRSGPLVQQSHGTWITFLSLRRERLRAVLHTHSRYHVRFAREDNIRGRMEGGFAESDERADVQVPTAPERGTTPFAEHPLGESNLLKGRKPLGGWTWLALVLILLVGAAFRFTGVNWDDYQHLHPDERFLTMVETAVELPNSVGEYFDTATSPLNPYNKNFGLYVYGTFPLFVTKFTAVFIQPIGHFLATEFLKGPPGSYTGRMATVYSILTDSAGYDGITLVGRVLSAICDLSTVLLIFLIGRRLYSARVGLLAALLLAGSVLDIQQSHFFTVDTFSNVPLLLSFWFALDIVDGGGWSAFILSGAFLGLAVAGRINTALFAAIITLAAALRLIRTMNGQRLVLRVAPAPAQVRTYAMSTDALRDTADEDAGGDGKPARVINLGPFAIELESRPKRIAPAPADETAPAPPETLPATEARAEGITTRVVNFGPFAIELDFRSASKPAAALAPAGAEATAGEVPGETALQAETPVEAAESIWANPVVATLAGLALAAAASLVVFRIAQPYAFTGLIGLNPKFLQDMNYIRDLIAGNIDYPPGHQWTDRTAFIFPFSNMVFWGLGPPLAIAGWLGFVLAGVEMVRRRNWQHLLMFFWVGGMFLYMGQQFVKTMRYFLPLYPFLALLAAYLLFWLWDQASHRTQIRNLTLQGALRYLPRALVALAFAVVVGYTLFYAAAFTSIYARPVSRVAASRWIYQNVPVGSVLGNEHWDDPLPLRIDGKDPFGGIYNGIPSSQDGLMHWYDEDTPDKRTQAIQWLDQVNYIILSSNRLYGSITRLPLRYPMTTKYYEWLFNGKLGFQLVGTFTSHPQLLGIDLNDDNAEEAFTVYDHPKVLIFKKTQNYSHDNTAALFNSVDLSEVYRQKPLDATISHNAFQMTPQEAAANYAGGTWSDIFQPDDFINRVPVIAWLVVLEVVGLLAFPILFIVFRAFADRGYAFAKTIGILVLAWGAWTLPSYRLVPFGRPDILISLGALLIAAALIAWWQRRELWGFVRANISLLLVEELVFVGFFGLSLWIRFGNPDLWHPNFGGEKPMDFAYLNAIIKTTWFPPYNPWFEGGYINYYYFGQVISATLVRLTGIVPEVAYNLLLPMFYGLTAVGAFGVGFNLVLAAQRRAFSALPASPDVRLPRGRAIVGGLLAAAFVLLIGNLGQVGVLGQALMQLGTPLHVDLPGLGGLFSVLTGAGAWLIGRRELPVPIGNWYWNATRVIPDTINEFPFFTFLYADLHAHLMSLAFTLVALGFALHAVLVRARLKWFDLVVLALVIGSLRAINTWDYPTYLAVAGAAMVVGYFADKIAPEDPAPSWGERLQRYLLVLVILFVQIALLVIPANIAGVKVTTDVLTYGLMVAFALVLGWIVVGSALNPISLANTIGWRFIAVVALAILLYWPFVSNYGSAYTSVELWKDQRTTLRDYLVVHGIFLFIIATYFILENFRRTRRGEAAASAQPAWMGELLLYAVPALAVFETGLLLLNLTVFAVVLPLVMLGSWLILRRDSTPERRLIAMLMVIGLLMTLMVEVIVLKGDIGRMNTVFKFYLQAWVMFSVSGAAGLVLMFDRLVGARVERAAPTPAAVAPQRASLGGLRQAWWGVFAVLLCAGLLYPVFATWAKVNDRFVPGSPPGVNGMQYMLGAHYGENNHDIALAPDYAAIQWIRENIKGSPVIAEANTGLYRWGDRISINTGLPTIIGWDWHTKQQYSLIDGSIIDNRIQDLKTLYDTPDPNAALQLLKRYHVSYVYVGPLEGAVYDPVGLAKFQAMAAAGELAQVYDSDGVQIYMVNATATALSR